MEIRYLGNGEKERSRPLCEACFPEDTVKFTDYYYQEKCRDNRILAMADDAGKIVSMVHLNPFTVSLCGELLPVHYLVAVATASERRRQGLMRTLLERALRDCYDRGEAFSFLMPANPAYYTPFGYRYWQNQREWSLPKELRGRLADVIAGEERGGTIPVSEQLSVRFLSRHPQLEAEAADFANQVLKAHFDLYIRRDAAYCGRLIREQLSEDGDILALMDGVGQIEGTVCCSQEGKLEFREPIFKAGLHDRIHPFLMGRIVHLQRFVERLRFPEPFSSTLAVRDDILPENTGVYRFYIDDQSAAMDRVADDGTVRQMDIAYLGELFFDRLRIFINELV